MTEKKIEKAWKEYQLLPKEHGYKSVKDINNKYANLLEELATAEKEEKAHAKPQSSIRSRLKDNRKKVSRSNDSKLAKPVRHNETSL